MWRIVAIGVVAVSSAGGCGKPSEGVTAPEQPASTERSSERRTPLTSGGGTGAVGREPERLALPDLNAPVERDAKAFKVKFEDEDGQRYLSVTYLRAATIWDPEVTIRLLRDDGATHEVTQKWDDWMMDKEKRVKVPTSPYKEVWLRGKGRGAGPVVINAGWSFTAPKQ